MASLSLAFGGAAATVAGRRRRRRRVVAPTGATRNPGSSGKEEKRLLDFILGGLQKEDQLLETDPILNKVDDNGTASTSKSGSTARVSAPNNKKKTEGTGGGVFGGLFAKK
ncbi:hypothetical protein AXF42_Ash018276 [Apostasia shenzhenica]|uniref:Thylakoid soluble phosphoprotein TSP9 n=1 Tax=Apostasia shenzhenica TaxID=1088818 RepID=A0A2I0B2M5_9ASPA|nr:hypothetical protein AXF42_Ash018276 [Apostasia shenzhenica]